MGFWSRLLGWVTSFFDKVAGTMTGKLAAGLADIALGVVIELASGNLTNEEKRDEAFQTIKELAIQEGIEFSTSAINLAIEAAYAVYKEESGQ